MVAILSTVQGYEPWLFGVAVGTISWLLFEGIVRAGFRIHKRKPSGRPVALTADTFMQYLMTSSTLLAMDCELATGLGVDLSTEPRNPGQLSARALALGIGDLAALDSL